MDAAKIITTVIARLKRLFTIAIITVLGFGIVWAALIYFNQASMIYFPRGYSPAELAGAEERVRKVPFRISAGEQTAFYVPPAGSGGTAHAGISPQRLWLMFGGNGARALDWLDLIDSVDLRADGFLLVDYPGYGLCEGKPNPATIEEAMRSAVETWVRTRAPGEEATLPDVAVLGHSLGSAVALMAAERYGAEQIILMSPFTTMKEMAAHAVGSPLSHLLRHHYDCRAPLRRLLQNERAKLTIIHGSDDEIIPQDMGRELSAIDPERIRFHAIRGAGHNDIVYHAFTEIRDAMREGQSP